MTSAPVRDPLGGRLAGLLDRKVRAGLAAAVNAVSEGLRTVVVEDSPRVT